MSRLACVVVLSCLVVGCGGSDDESNGSGSGGTSSGGSAGASAGGSSGSATGGSGGGGTGGAAAGPSSLPNATGTCPDFVNGTITLSPAGIPPRDVQLWISDAAASLDGPLIFYWHGTGSQPLEAAYGIGDPQIDAILALGGMVIAPVHDPGAGTFPWYLTAGGGKEDDLLVADEALACAMQKVGVDTTHIHSMGMSAGGLMTAQMGYRRSAYIASIVPYSGGLFGSPPNQDPANLFAAMIFHGGATDEVVGVQFQAISEALQADLEGKGHFAFLCNHGKGHSIPTDARPNVLQFLSAHPYGTNPSPYVGGFPSGFPSYCAL
jgi:predicted esterase